MTNSQPGVDELRNVMATNYEDVRAVFARIREGDLSRTADGGAPVWRLVAGIIISVRRDVRAAERLAAAQRATQPPISRIVAAVSDWRATRAFAATDRTGVLAAWENTFNDLFSCVNDLSVEPIGASDATVDRSVTAACAYLRDGVSRWPERTEELRQAIGSPRSTE